jgi:hypothetical protein
LGRSSLTCCSYPSPPRGRTSISCCRPSTSLPDGAFRTPGSSREWNARAGTSTRGHLQEPFRRLTKPHRVAWAHRRPTPGCTHGGGGCLLPAGLLKSFGLTALEALARGAPVIVPNRGSLPRVIGDAAIFTEP